MHESGMCDGVLDAALRRAGDRHIAGLKLRAGVFLRVDQAAMQQAIDIAGAGTKAEGARIEVIQVPARASCRDCGADASVYDPLPACPGCGSFHIDIEGGGELILGSLEFRPEDA